MKKKKQKWVYWTDKIAEEVRKKVKIGKIEFPATLIYLGYDYYECPICHWFKFVKKA